MAKGTEVEGYTWMGSGFMCLRCGCLVASVPVHNAWHVPEPGAAVRGDGTSDEAEGS